MGGWVLVIFLLSLELCSPISGQHVIEKMIPEIQERVSQVGKILLPVPEDSLQEAWFLAGSYVIPLDSLTERCRNHSAVFFESYLKSDMWALKMLDASGKPGAGLIDGNIMDLGNYDECVGVTAPQGLFRGQHCIVETRGILPADLLDKISPSEEFMSMIRKDVMFALCVPDSCTVEDVKAHMDVTLNSVNATALMYHSSCSSATTPPLDLGDYLAISLIIIIIVVIVLSTCYEHLTPKSERKELLVSFSITSNTRQLLSTASPPSSLSCLHGLRVLAMAWIVLGHRFLLNGLVPSRSFAGVLRNVDSLAWTPMQNINLVVDIFFLLSGTLAAYNFFRDRHKGKQFNYLRFCVHRYRRLTPPLLLVTLFYATLLIRVTDGPVWKRMASKYHEGCRENWWINFLYISNYFTTHLCVPQSWYLGVDFQLHLISPLLLLLIHKQRTRGFLLAGVVFLASNAAAMSYFYSSRLRAGGIFQGDRVNEVSRVFMYASTHFRLTSFVIGLCLGYLLFQIKQQQFKVKLSKLQLVMGWGVATLMFLATVMSTSVLDDPNSQHILWVDTLHGVWNRVTLALPVAWVILACTIGCGGIVDKLLSWKSLIPLSRLTYCVYLLHMFVQMVHIFRTRTSLTVETLDVWYLFFADMFITYLLATLLYLGVEAPVSNVFNHLFKDSEKSTEKSQNVVLPTLTILQENTKTKEEQNA